MHSLHVLEIAVANVIFIPMGDCCSLRAEVFTFFTQISLWLIAGLSSTPRVWFGSDMTRLTSDSACDSSVLWYATACPEGKFTLNQMRRIMVNSAMSQHDFLKWLLSNFRLTSIDAQAIIQPLEIVLGLSLARIHEDICQTKECVSLSS